MMIKRAIEKHFREVMNYFPIATITGPRQAGKTTFAKMLYPDYKYVNLEDRELRQLAETDPKEFLKRYHSNVILDEVQNVPELLSYLQVLVDEDRTPARFILTGSMQFKLMEGVTQSLAGRTAVFTMSPLSIAELKSNRIEIPDRDELLQRGFMPQLYAMRDMPPSEYYRMYYQTYVERDVSRLRQVHQKREFDLFVRLLAGRVGGLLNLSSLANDIGVSSQTLKDWLSLLETSHIIYLLHPFHANIKKRLVKTPKIYFYEPGLAAWLLGAHTPDMITTLPQLGGLFENMVVMEVVKQLENDSRQAQVFFYRDSQNREIDLVVWRGSEVIPFEIKAARTSSFDMASNVVWFAKNIPNASPGTVLYAGTLEFEHEGCKFLNYQNINFQFSNP